MTEHPITPPPELMQQWAIEWHEGSCTQELLEYIATQAARWGADQELEACINEIYRGVGLRHIDYSSNRESLCSDLRAARRPKPPSLKEQALETLRQIPIDPEAGVGSCDLDTIRRALEALPE